MTREDARIKLIEIRAQLEVILSMYRLEISDVFDVAIEALEQEPILDKIRAEIIDKYMTATGEVNTVAKGCLQIIDKYKAESEDKE